MIELNETRCSISGHLSRKCYLFMVWSVPVSFFFEMKFSIVTLAVIGIAVLCGPEMVKGHPGKVTTNVQHTEATDPDANGFWQKKVSWKSRWVKYWQQKAIYVPLWKKVWGPVVQSEWVPIPKPPPDWQYEEEHKEKW